MAEIVEFFRRRIVQLELFKKKGISEVATLPRTLSREEGPINVLEDRVLIGGSVELITSEQTEPFTPGAHMEVVQPNSEDFDHAASVLKVLEPTRMEHVGEIIWQALRKGGRLKTAVRLQEVFNRFLKRNIKHGSVWEGENAIIYRFDSGEESNKPRLELVKLDSREETDGARFRAIIRDGSFDNEDNGVEEVIYEEEELKRAA